MLEIIDCVQGSPEWFAARMKIPTASEFKTIIGVKKDAKDKVTRQTYMYKLAGEILTDEPMENYSNQYMARGTEVEDELRRLYCMMENCEVRQTGFLRSDRKGASPDGLVGGNGMLEIKSQAPHLLIKTIFAGEAPPEYYAQLQGNLYVGEREWIDLCVGFRKMPPFIKKVYRDEPYIKMLAQAVDDFNQELDEVVARIKAFT